MKTLLPTFLAMLIAAGLALFVYDRFVLVPRLEVASKTAEVNLANARQQATDIAIELDASVERSVAGAKSAFDQQAAAEDVRRAELEQQARQMTATAQAAEALARAGAAKVALAEYYMSMGTWPEKAADVGIGKPTDFAGGPVAAIAVEPEGVITITMKPEIGAGARLRLVPRVTPGGMVEWTCRASGYPAAERLPGCKP